MDYLESNFSIKLWVHCSAKERERELYETNTIYERAFLFDKVFSNKIRNFGVIGRRGCDMIV